jgi:hypothetical protein
MRYIMMSLASWRLCCNTLERGIHLLKEEEEVEHADSASGPTKKNVRKTYF